MIKIIDATLSKLKNITLSNEQIMQFIQLNQEIGIQNFRITPEIYEQVEALLPENINICMEIDSMQNRDKFTKVERFELPRVIEKGVTTSIQLNDIHEIIQLKKYIGVESLKIVGIEDFLCINYKKAFQEILQILKGTTIILCPENGFDCATALAVMYLQNGGCIVETAFAGTGNLAATEQVLLAMQQTARYKINQKYSKLVDLVKLYEEMTQITIPGKMPIIGRQIFSVESGVHVDGILKNPSNYEAYPPELVGQKREIVIGKHSGSSSVHLKIKELGIPDVTAEQCHQALVHIKQKSNQLRRSITDEEFIEIVRETG